MLTRMVLVGVLAVSACGPRGTMVVDPAAAHVGQVERIFVASNRDPQGTASPRVNYSRVDVAVPPLRSPGTITYPRKGKKPDPQRDFMVSDYASYRKEGDFRHDLARALAQQPRKSRDVILFVHGYNNTFTEGLYRFAQIDHDLKLPGVPVHFSWPSRGQPLAYTGDRDAVLFSRDGLVRSIRMVTEAGQGKPILMAHSMGAALLMESLRQLAISGDERTLSRIGGVVLLSPDIDLQVFRMQAQAIPKLPQPFIIFTSKRDKALNLSALIASEPVRLGTVTDARLVADLPVTLVDTGAFSTGSGHFNVAESPALMQILARAGEMNRVFSSDSSAGVGPLTRAAMTVERAAQIVISPSF